MDCIFCKIVKGELPSIKVYEDVEFLAFMNIYPASKGHVLIIPKNHIAWMQDADDATVSKTFIIAKNLMTKIKAALFCDYVQVSVLGEEVQHFHVHLIPRHHKDGLPTWTPVSYDSTEEMESYAKKLQ
jgi:histidine triad (HIT) family protein